MDYISIDVIDYTFLGEVFYNNLSFKNHVK